jgi:anti-sigma regulatory factor (Ser/Thr protein kinase)
MPKLMTLKLQHNLSEVARIFEWVDEFIKAHGLPDRAGMQVALALDELVTNTISYGYPDGPRDEPAVTLTIRLDGEFVVTTLEDQGVAFDPFAMPAPDTTLNVEERGIGGLGVHLVRELMDDVSYQRVGNVNRLTLRKRVCN